MAKERVERDEEDLVRLYLTDIGQYPLLTKEDEVRLAQAIEAGNEAREQLEAEAKPTPPETHTSSQMVNPMGTPRTEKTPGWVPDLK